MAIIAHIVTNTKIMKKSSLAHDCLHHDDDDRVDLFEVNDMEWKELKRLQHDERDGLYVEAESSMSVVGVPLPDSISVVGVSLPDSTVVDLVLSLT